MTTKLKQYFPLAWERDEILSEIQSHPQLSKIYEGWKEKQRMEFLDFMTGVRGIKFLYDSFFKELMNPEFAPERLEEFLSLLLGNKIKILSVLPVDSTRIADEGSLLVMDIVVQLESGEIVDLEIQKIGYMFPGQRSACYSSDLLLRQYKRIRSDENEKTFSYRDIKNVYTIVLFESSPEIFHKFPDIYLHYFEQQSNTGLEMDLLQKYLFVPLDIFKKKMHNKNKKEAENKLEAWLLFLCDDDPETVLQLSEDYPEFKKMYEEGYQMCRNIEGVMKMFSKELEQLDRNTAQLMIDEMQKRINEQNDQIVEKNNQLKEKDLARERAIKKCYLKLKDIDSVTDIMGTSRAEVEKILQI